MIHFFPYEFDLKQTDVLRTLFVDEKQSQIVLDKCPSDAIPVFLTNSPTTESLFCAHRAPVSLFFDLHDSGKDYLKLSLEVLNFARNFRLHIVYVKLQIHDPAFYASHNPLHELVHVVSCPLLLGGSRWHITTQKDVLGDRLFRNVFQTEPNPDYRFDWSWIGAKTSNDRRIALATLKNFGKLPRFFKIARPGHDDALNASISHPDYLAASRASKVCVSLNGNGPWCLKDGELFAHHCFVLRQVHKAIAVNPLTPRDGNEWIVFRSPQEAVSMIEYYSKAQTERERIRDAGNSMFHEVLFENRWAKYYLRHLTDFLKHPQKEVWQKLIVG